MTDIPLDPHFQLNQVLTQLAKTTPASDVARQAIEVIVRQLAANQISLTPTRSAQIKEVLLSNTALQGTINSGQTYLLKLNQESLNLLQFFSKTEPDILTKLPISEQFVQLLLKLPANQLSQLFSHNKLNFVADLSNKNANLFAVLQGTVVDLTRLEQANKPGLVNIKLSTSGALISIPVDATNNLQKGDKVNLELAPKGKNWQLTVLAGHSMAVTQNRLNDQLSLSLQSKQNLTNTQSAPSEYRSQQSDNRQVTEQNRQSVASALKVWLAPEVASELIKTVLQQQASKQNIELSLPLKTFIAQLSQSGVSSEQALLKQVLNLVPEKISVKITQSGENSLHIQHPKLIANLPLSPQQLESLVPLKIVDASQVRTHLSQNIDLPAIKQVNQISESASKLSLTTGLKTEQTALNTRGNETDLPAKAIKPTVTPEGLINKPQSLPATSPSTLSKVSIPMVDNAVVTQTISPKNTNITNELSSAIPPAPAVKSYPSTLPEFKMPGNIVEVKTNLPSVVTPEFVSSKPVQQQLFQDLLRLSQPKAELPGTVLLNIEKILSEPASLKIMTEPAAQTWVKQIAQELRQAVPQGNEQDASQIKQLLSASTLPLSAVQLVSPPASQGLLSGLVTLLQVSLASRLLRNQPSQAERLAQILPAIFSAAGKEQTPANPVKTLQEFGQLEQRGQLVREISRLLADHQSNKLTNAEKLLQGQESFYYSLPNLFGDKFNNIELLIKREEQNKQGEQQKANATKTWQLTMKLSVGELGELLSKAKLRPDHVEIDFYASNDQVNHQVMNFMPLLKRRLATLGIEVTKSQCQLGKIPTTLADRPYQLFQTKA